MAIRLICWQVPPAFSDDLLRYRWEGRLQAHGGNPYSVRPVDRPDLLRAEDNRLPGRDFKAVYGPLLLWTEHLAYQVSGENLLALRWPYALADLALLLLLAWRFRLGFLTYAWCPLPAFEFWSGGHNDSLCLLALALALWAFRAGRPRAAWIALGCAILTKWWPVLLIPLLAGRERRNWRDLCWIALPALPFLPLYWPRAIAENAQFASGFLGGWRNNDSLFGGLLWLTGGDLYRAKYLAFALLAAWIAWLTFRPWTATHKALAAVAGLLTLSANVHPWYVTWLLPFLVETPRMFGFVWLVLVPVTYETVIVWNSVGMWDGIRPSRWLVYAPVWLAIVLSSRRLPESTRTL